MSTPGSAPAINVFPATNILSNSAVINGSVNPYGSPTNVFIDYGNTETFNQTVQVYESVISENNSISINNSIYFTYPFGTTVYYRIRATNNFGTSYSATNSFELIQPEIGDNYAGGIVFYVNDAGTFGLVCTSTDQSTNAPWGCSQTYQGAINTGLGTGNLNTEVIIVNCGETNTAAAICSNLVYNGYDDWYLPSNDELNLMYTNLKLNGLGNFATARYWSSTEFNSTTAYDCLFYTGEINIFAGSKTNLKHVRAVRIFIMN